MKKTYQNMNEHILPGEDLNQKVLGQASSPKPVRTRRPLMAVAAVLTLILLVTPVMAGNAPTIAELMYNVSPEMAARFVPVAAAVEKNGIRMEVVSASFHGATAEICISFEDLEGDRIDWSLRTESRKYLRGMDLFAGPGGGGLGIKNMDYNPETGKYMMVIEANYSFYSEWLGRYQTVDELFNGKITVCIDEISWKNTDGAKESLEGPWIVAVDVQESDYVGERDDGVPQITRPAE